jgi:hypothetical protein
VNSIQNWAALVLDFHFALLGSFFIYILILVTHRQFHPAAREDLRHLTCTIVMSRLTFNDD